MKHARCTRPKHFRLFRVICDKMSNKHEQLLFHCEVRWPSRGKVLSKFFELCDKFRVFLMEGYYEGKLTSSYLECVTDKNSLKRLAYSVDNVSALDVFKLTVHGEDVHKFFVQDKVDAMTH